jgi:glycosyltransferase involved in cell wall biosynthesis
MLAENIPLITVNWNSKNALELTLKSYVYWHYEKSKLPLLVIDNNSTDGSVEWMRENEIPHISLPENVGHMRGVNLALKELGSKFDWVFLTDSDLRFDANVLNSCSGAYLVYANLQRLFLGQVHFSKPIPDSWRSIAASISGQWWIKRLQPARCLMNWSELKKLGLRDFHPQGEDERFFDLHADPGCYFYSEIKRLGIQHSPFPEGTFHYELSSFRGDGTYPDRQFEIRETIPKDSEKYKDVPLLGRFCHFSEALR